MSPFEYTLTAFIASLLIAIGCAIVLYAIRAILPTRLTKRQRARLNRRANRQAFMMALDAQRKSFN